MCKECFEFFDKDSSGSIDKTELITVMRAVGLNPSKKEVDKIIKSVAEKGENLSLSLSLSLSLITLDYFLAHLQEQKSQVNFSEHLLSVYFSHFTSSSPEPLSQFHPNSAQSVPILRGFEEMSLNEGSRSFLGGR